MKVKEGSPSARPDRAERGNRRAGRRKSERPPAPSPVVVVGAGLAGLCCALHLERRGHAVQLLEAGEAPGGRVATDLVRGFALDRGFQVLFDAYPEVRAEIDLEALELGRFAPGAMVFDGQRMARVGDPLRRPQDLVATLTSGLVTAGDAARLARWRVEALRAGPEGWTAAAGELDALAALRARGFSNAIIERFWRPFLGGVLLDRELRASDRTLAFVFRHLATGHATLPAGGMGALPARLAARLRPGTLRTRVRVARVEPRAVHLASGERVGAAAVVVATDPLTASRLIPTLPAPPTRDTATLYLDAPKGLAPRVARHLVLDGTGRGPVNTLCVPSAVARGYAPEGHELVSASLLEPVLDEDDDVLEARARAQLRTWFGNAVEAWTTLRLVRVPRALPAQPPGPLAARPRGARLDDGLFVAGDHRDVASIQGAMASGRRAAGAVAEALVGSLAA